MHDRLSAPISVLWVMLILLLVPGVAETCVIAPRTLRAGQTFTVSVADRGRPVAGVELVLYGYEPESGTDKFTDEQGNVRFSGLNPGLYFLSPEYDAEGSDIVKVEVVPGDSTNVTIPVKWPRSTPIAVRSAAGQIRGPNFYASQLQPQISLSLLESVSARVLESIRADNKGRFAFKTSFPPGLYFIRLSPPGLRDKLRDPIEGLDRD